MPKGKTVFYKQGHFGVALAAFLTLAPTGVGFGLSNHTTWAHVFFALSFPGAAIALWIMLRYYGIDERVYVALLLGLAGGIFAVDRLSMLEPSSKAQIVILGIIPVPVRTDKTWPHVNVIYKNAGTLAAHAITSHISVRVEPLKLSDAEIISAQQDLLSWTSGEWLALLRSHRNEELASGAPGLMFSFPDVPNEIAAQLEEMLPQVVNQKSFGYVMVAFKYWDDSMPAHIFGVKETCVFFVNDLDLNRTCGRNGTLVVKEQFAHDDL
jgi:hypothetical protein